jgi:hypothetical protein
MPTALRNNIRREVLRYMSTQTAPVRVSNMAQELRNHHERFRGLRDEDFLAVVQPMIVTGTLRYMPGLKIKICKDS